MSNNIFKQVESYVTDLFETHKKSKLAFHSLAHTQQIVRRAEEIGMHYNLEERDMNVVKIAAWFHDTGYLFTGPENHEERSVEQMKLFMEANYPDPDVIQLVEGCILATKQGSNP